jgi:hypothetical protein
MLVLAIDSSKEEEEPLSRSTQMNRGRREHAVRIAVAKDYLLGPWPFAMTTVKAPVRDDRLINIVPKGVLPASESAAPTTATNKAMPTIHH